MRRVEDTDSHAFLLSPRRRGEDRGILNPHRGSNRNKQDEPVYYPVKGVDIKLTSCERWGSGAIITFAVTNNTDIDKNFLFTYTGDPCDSTQPEPLIVDNSGNAYNGGPIKLGGAEFVSVLGYMEAKIPAGITIKGIYEVKNLPASCNSLSVVTIGGVELGNKRTPFEYSFSNIPVATKVNTNSSNVTCSLPTMYVKYMGLKRDGKDLVLTFSLTNQSNRDMSSYHFMEGLSISNYSSDGDSFRTKLFIRNEMASYGNAEFPSEAPVKCQIRLYDVPMSVTSFSLVRLVFLEGHKIEFKNISL